MSKYRLHWTVGKPQIVEGTDIADACRRAGIGAGALRALDYYEDIDTETADSAQQSVTSNTQ